MWLDALTGGDTAYTIAPDWREQLQDDDVEVFKSEEEIRALLETLQITSDKDVISRMNEDYDQLRKLLAEGGNASEKAVRSIVSFLRTTIAEKQTASTSI